MNDAIFFQKNFFVATDFQKNLSELLENHTQEEVGKLLGVSGRSVANYVAGGTPHPKTIRKAEELVNAANTKSLTVTDTGLNYGNDEPFMSVREMWDLIVSQQQTIRSQEMTINLLASK